MWPNPWEDNLIFEMMRQSKPMPELKRKADKARRLKGKIWTVEELDYAHAKGRELVVFFAEQTKYNQEIEHTG